jgi:2-oxo-4-hydroxy-4-carboxy-5-ureidoimidazoline decarboxylase
MKNAVRWAFGSSRTDSKMPARMSLSQVNAITVRQFVECFGKVAEHSPWVAEDAANERPFTDRDAMIGAFESAIRTAPAERQLQLLRAHPDLAGKAREITDDSHREQAEAGLDDLSRDEFARFTALNNHYRSKFGFPFILAVKGATKHQILAAFEERIDNSSGSELATALAQVARILRLRLEDRVEP